MLSGGDLFTLLMAFYFTVSNESTFNLLQREHVVKSDGGKLYLISPFLIFELTKHVRVNDARSDHKNFLYQSTNHQTFEKHQVVLCYMEVQFLMVLY